jgi:hypothetical protein
MGLVPGADQSVTVTFANGASYGISAGPLKGTGYTMFVVDYQEFNAKGKKPAQPEKIVSVSWSGQSGAVDGIEGDHRLTGRVLALSQTHSVEVVLRPAAAGRTTAFGSARLTDDGSFFSAATPLSLATTDPSGAAVITGRRPVLRMTNINGVPSKAVFDDGPLAAGVLPRGSSDIGVDLTTGKVAAWRAVSERLPDGSVIFAISGTVGLSTDPSRDSITAVTWTNPDGTRGRIAVSQKPSDMAHTYR